jgi:hypothetical protein
VDIVTRIIKVRVSLQQAEFEETLEAMLNVREKPEGGI